MKTISSSINMEQTLKREILGGITTFLSMAHILAVNPQVLSLAGVKGVSEDEEMDQSAIFCSDCISSICRSRYSWD